MHSALHVPKVNEEWELLKDIRLAFVAVAISGTRLAIRQSEDTFAETPRMVRSRGGDRETACERAVTSTRRRNVADASTLR
jgi:hypothetical protein